MELDGGRESQNRADFVVKKSKDKKKKDLGRKGSPTRHDSLAEAALIIRDSTKST